MKTLPTGTVTFMFTDIEGSTRLVQSLGDRWRGILETHDAAAREAVEAHGGVVVRTEGDAVFAVFDQATSGVAAAVDLQVAIDQTPWPDDGVIRVRIGLHTGAGVLGGGDYVGLDVHRAARIAATGAGGQIVVSDSTAALVDHLLPDGTFLRDLGKHRLKDLNDSEAIFQIVVPGISDRFPPLRTLERVAHNLPVQVTSFVGREAEISEAMTLLETNRVLTLLGPGGTGKTRLALQVAAECAERFPDGTFFVPLASITDPDLIPSTILSTLGVPASTRSLSPREHLTEVLSQRSALLVLDNFEQIIEGAGVVADLIRCSPASRVLITSRIPLRIAGEQEMPIGPLGIAETSAERDPGALAEVPAIRLFIERVLTVNRNFVLDRSNAPAVAELVRRLDGLPLAIELVVPQLRLLPVGEVLERLDPSHLGGGSRDTPDRHKTLWNAIAWSVETLPESSRSLFTRLAAFVGGARLDEIEAVAGGDVVEDLATLVEHSLVVRDQSSSDVRFRWLRVIREYALELLRASSDSEAVVRAHAGAYTRLAEAAAREVLMVDRDRWLELLDHDHDNLRAALDWSIEVGEAELASRLAASLWRFWQTRGHIHEAQTFLDRVMEFDDVEPAVRAKAIEAAGGIAWWQGDLALADQHYGAALELQRQLGDPGEIANALYNNALSRAYGSDDAESPIAMLAEAEQIYSSLGDEGGLANVHWGLGSLAYRGRVDPAESAANLRKAVSGYRAVGNLFGEMWANFELAAMLLREGDHLAAEPYLRQALQVLGKTRDYSALVMFSGVKAMIANRKGETELAVRLAGVAYGLRDLSGVDLISVEANEDVFLAESAMDTLEGPLAEAYRQGHDMRYDEALDYLLSVG